MFLSQRQGDWNNAVGDNDDDGDDDDEIWYDEDDEEDEFGLPSIASMRKRKDKGIQTFPARADYSAEAIDTHLNGSPSLTSSLGNRRLRANSSDIAEERGALIYPTAKQSEGKILRPQYKELLNGNFFCPAWAQMLLTMGLRRSCKLAQLNRPFSAATERDTETTRIPFDADHPDQ